MEYKIGEILVSKKDIEVERLTGEKLIIPKGNKVIIGADKLGHHIDTGLIQRLSENMVVNDYDTEGLANYLHSYLKSRFPIISLIDELDKHNGNFTKEIKNALEEIGF